MTNITPVMSIKWTPVGFPEAGGCRTSPTRWTVMPVAGVDARSAAITAAADRHQILGTYLVLREDRREWVVPAAGRVPLAKSASRHTLARRAAASGCRDHGGIITGSGRRDRHFTRTGTYRVVSRLPGTRSSWGSMSEIVVAHRQWE